MGNKRKKVIIVGGGFGGLNAAKHLAGADVDILLLDKTNHHLFQPLLYQVATAALSPANIASPIRDILRDQKNATVFLDEVALIDKNKKSVTVNAGQEFFYDYLIVAVGARHSYFGRPEWEAAAPGLKTLTDAVRIREKILLAFEEAERSSNPEIIERFLRFVVIGGGPTGVEMAGAISEISHKTLFNNFRNIRPENSEIYLIEGEDRILPGFSPKLSETAKKDLEKMGVTVLVNTQVTDVGNNGISFQGRFLSAGTVVWAAGNKAPPFLKTLDTPLDHQGRVIVEKDLSIPGSPNIFVIGDAACVSGEDQKPLPGVAPVAIQQGKYVAGVILKSLSLKQRKPFIYRDKGKLATIGRSKAVGSFGDFECSGFFAWFLWGVIHIFYLISFRNRFLVLAHWFFLYLTQDRDVRLIKENDEK